MELVDIAGPVTIHLHYRKLQAICPVTKALDTYNVEIELISKGQKTVELRSLAGYLKKFHAVEILCESLAYQIMCDLAVLRIFFLVKVNLHQYASEEVEMNAIATYHEDTSDS